MVSPAVSAATGDPRRAPRGRVPRVGVANFLSDADTRDTGLGVHVADLPVAALTAGETIEFTFLWLDTQTWEGRDHAVRVTAA